MLTLCDPDNAIILLQCVKSGRLHSHATPLSAPSPQRHPRMHPRMHLPLPRAQRRSRPRPLPHSQLEKVEQMEAGSHRCQRSAIRRKLLAHGEADRDRVEASDEAYRRSRVRPDPNWYAQSCLQLCLQTSHLRGLRVRDEEDRSNIW